MSKPKIPNQRKANLEHKKRTERYAQLIQQIYDRVAQEAARKASLVDYDPTKPFSFADYPLTRREIEKLQAQLMSEVSATIMSGTSAEWKEANLVQDLVAKKVLTAYTGTNKFGEEFTRYFQTNPDSLKAFQQRKDKGMNLSSRVWKLSEQYKAELEDSITAAIAPGMPAMELAAQVKKYLNEPNKRFRRIKEKQEDGNFKWKLSKNAQAYHPGQGVYRSSARNAQRLARTEINMAYRTAEQTRWKQFDFVVGYEVHITRNEARHVPDICDDLAGKYPKDFVFKGWHPQCYSDDSEVLTNQGWKLFKNVADDDLILSLNPDTRQMEWVGIVDRQCYDRNGEMIHFYNKSLDCLVTPEHRMAYIAPNSGQISYISAEQYNYTLGGFIYGETRFYKESVIYSGKVYDLTLERNHIMYIRRNGKCFWGSNCMCYTIPILKTEEEFWADDSEDSTASVNEVKNVPEGFEKWVEKNQGRIEEAERRGTLPYFIKDNQKAVNDVLYPKQKTALEIAAERHAARTPEDVERIQKEWNERRLNSQVDIVMNKAKQAGAEIQSLAENIARNHNALITPINYKSKESILRKVLSERNNPMTPDFAPNDLKDTVRNTIIVSKNKLDNVIKDLQSVTGFMRYKPQNTELGYSGNIINILAQNGIVAEIQVNTAAMIYAKETPDIAKKILGEELWNKINRQTKIEGGLGHKYYEEWRILSDLEKQSEKGMTILRKSVEYYSHFKNL